MLKYVPFFCLDKSLIGDLIFQIQFECQKFIFFFIQNLFLKNFHPKIFYLLIQTNFCNNSLAKI